MQLAKQVLIIHKPSIKSRDVSKKDVDSSKKRTRHKWTEEEDEKLKRLVAEYLDPKPNRTSWLSIAKYMGKDFLGKQCRERYVNHLREDVENSPLTDLEKRKILQFGKDNGPRPNWSALATEWNRTEAQVRNYWHNRQKQNRKKRAQKDEATKRIPDDSFNLRNDESPLKDHNSSSSSSNASEGQLEIQQAIVDDVSEDQQARSSAQSSTRSSDSSSFEFSPVPPLSLDAALNNSTGWELVDWENLPAFNGGLTSPVPTFHPNAPAVERPVSPSTKALFDSLPQLMDLDDKI